MKIFSVENNLNVGFLKTTNPLHFTDIKERPVDDDISGSFAGMLSGLINKVNNLQLNSEELTRKMIHEPESVNIHSVMIAGQKAEIALNFTKSIRDEAIRAFRELIALR